MGDPRPQQDPMAVMLPGVEVEHRPLARGCIMVALEQARGHLEQLGLSQAALMLDIRLEAAAHKALPYAEFLADLLGIEAVARRERYLTARTRLAHLPFHKTLDQFEFSFQPSIDQRQVKELATMAFAHDAANVVLARPARCR